MTALGVALTGAAGMLVLAFFFLDLAAVHSRSYRGIITFVLLPMLFVIGRLLGSAASKTVEDLDSTQCCSTEVG